ncbi:MAG: phosphoenolpyruvate synthase [Chloroflexi bacterium]|nr:MAG: phosphoenolpyruvate synthase [Chloroflexota bacterium]
MQSYIQRIHNKTQFDISSVGGKGANLIELAAIEGIHIPEGFCVTTDAYIKTFERCAELNGLLDQLSTMQVHHQDEISAINAQIRSVIENQEIPQDITDAIAAELQTHGEKLSYAVRSSATAEDLPTASFAGQHDTYLNIIGKDSILKHMRKCWASLFTDRAVMYRIHNRFDHRKVFLAVVVQRMVIPESSGIMFTADPVTSNRKIVSIDASYGLGEALVSGLVNSDNYKVQAGEIISKTIGKKNHAIYTLKNGGTEEREIGSDLRAMQALTNAQILELAQLGRQIENYFSCPQDIEWCRHENELYIVQSRPITTLYPIPERNDGMNHVYMSGGHLQMMTDPIKPLGMYFLKTVLGNNPAVYFELGGRLFLDLSQDLTSFMGRAMASSLLGAMGDDLLTNAVKKLAKQKQYIKTLPRGKDRVFQVSKDDVSFAPLIHAFKIYRKNDPDIVRKLIDKETQSIERLQQEIEKLSGDDLFAYIEDDHHGRRKKITTPEAAGAIAVPLLAGQWLNKKIEKWLGEKNAADTFIQSVPNSVTADAGLALLDVGDVVRKYPEVLAYFEHAKDETFFDDLAKLAGGSAVTESIQAYLDHFGMRCSGDIDITTARWSEKPTQLIPMILSNIRNFEPNARMAKHEQGIKESEERIQDFANRLEKLRGGKRKAKQVKKIAGMIRNHIGYREYPKFSYIQRYFIYKKALLKEAAKLVKKGILREKEDSYFLYFDELRETVKSGKVDYDIIIKRKAEYQTYEKLTPPRLVTSDGEIITGEYDKKDIPIDALPGVAVSSGIIEGRARIVNKMEDADLDEGDILVAEYTDPSWTPLFVSIKGLVTEVGGIATHGAIIAREYGLPAVVSVENATRLIKDGQMIRVNGTTGYVEIYLPGISA